ncbi:DUF4878 domain-containing protein [Campylobacter sp. LR264d]|uniref:DUF4878 domain-containing protein n=1 Tax=Campylobacter sp. LR264d TaxID=2593544 RepID=UPI00123AD802|nr:DUF4878 domain-containing protein [Campylobacter sp. LR264d]KAA6230116.1 DUF4878 domain-containing protein [Campylobacter sp. LR264d]
MFRLSFLALIIVIFIACSKEDTSISNNNITSPNVVAQDFIIASSNKNYKQMIDLIDLDEERLQDKDYIKTDLKQDIDKISDRKLLNGYTEINLIELIDEEIKEDEAKVILKIELRRETSNVQTIRLKKIKGNWKVKMDQNSSL